jgi:hypothetical protein|tara:strand:+ start:309 stop:452 length:144 start_codon:yes stop_codon:yes gene_type:complete
MRFKVKGQAIFGTYVKRLNDKIVIYDEEIDKYVSYHPNQLERTYDKD